MYVSPPVSGGLAPVPARKVVMLNFAVCGTVESLSADVADLGHHIQQNLAREYATNFGKRGASSHHQPDSVLVTTTMDLVSPRRREADDSVADAKPRGFFADQFEVG